MLKSRQMVICLAILLSACLVQVGAVFATGGQHLLRGAMLAAAVNALLCGALYYGQRERGTKPGIRNRLSETAGLPVLGAALCIVVTYILNFLESMMPAWFQQYNALMGEFDLSVLPWIAYTLLLAPVSEELIFRGAILSAAEKGFSFGYANLIQAVLFGVYHMNLIQGLYAFAIGLVFALAKKWAGSIIAAMLVHIGFNGTTYLLSLLVPEGDMPPIAVSVVLFGGSLLIGLALLHYYIRQSSSGD